MNENPNNNQEVVPVYANREEANQQNFEVQGNKLVVLSQQNISSKERIYNQQGEVQGEKVISYEKSELVIFIAGGKSLSKDNKEKAKPNQYNTVNVDDPELF